MLEVTIKMWGRGDTKVVAVLHIQQVKQWEGSVRDYKVEGFRQDMQTLELVETVGAKVLGHDRSRPVWELVAKACEEAK